MLAPLTRLHDPIAEQTRRLHALRQFKLQMRGLGLALMADSEDPHVDWLTLMWSRSFDRAHAMELLARQGSENQGFWLRRVQLAADIFDGLGATGQQHLRTLVLRHRARFGTSLAAVSE